MSDFQRVTINTDAAQDAPAAAPSPAQQPRFAPTARVIGGVVRTTIASSTDAFGTEQNTVTAHEHDLHRADSRDLLPTSGAVFTSPGGRVLSASEITPASTVTVGGITTNVRAAMHAGLLKQTDAGQYVSADGVPAAPPTSAEQEQQQQPAPNAESIEPLDPSAEAIMTSVVANLPQGIATAVSSELISTGDLSSAVAEIAAERLGITTDEVKQQAAQVQAAFKDQAARAVGPMAEPIFAFANQFARDELKAAIDKHVMTGSTSGYKALGQKFLTALPSVAPDLILESADFQAMGARRERSGEITLMLPQVGRVSWGVAVKQKLIDPSFT